VGSYSRKHIYRSENLYNYKINAMKNLIKLSTALVVLLAFSVQAYASDGIFRKKQDPQGFITISGKIVDQETKPLSYSQLLGLKTVMLLLFLIWMVNLHLK